ncbi:glycoside hydrolase family 47 protein [Rhodotorula paludigena]|uniref:glycoside hydrolase family 47 protein n=1 Tax=Rhodotorula paludigena TaxID=86838 RepID=UPI0031779652
MTILSEDGAPALPRRRTPSPPASSFPPRLDFFSRAANDPYQPLPSSDYASGRDRGLDPRWDEEREMGPWHALVAHRSGRATRNKVLLGVAGVVVLYLLHNAWTRPHHPPHWHGRPPHEGSEEHHGPLPPGPPTAPTKVPTYTQPTGIPVPVLETAELPLADLDELIQPRRPVPPTWPDPWAGPSVFGDHHKVDRAYEYLSPERFGSEETGWKTVPDPPKRDPPPAQYLLKAFEYSAASAGRRLDGRKAKLPPGMAFDERTGRPKPLDPKVLKLGQAEGWKVPKGFSATQLGTGKVGEQVLPRIQFEGFVEGEDDERSERAVEERRRREWVKRAFMHAWAGMSKYAYGHDEVSPVSNLFSDNYNGWGATIVDSLDTLLVMNMSHEYNIAREHVAAIDFTYLVPSGSRTFSTKLPKLSSLDLPPRSREPPEVERKPWVDPRIGQATNQRSPLTIPWFETTIRYLGGLISAYDLSSDPLMLQRATELGDWLLPAFATEHGLPLARYMIGLNPNGQKPGRSVLAEVGSMTLEMTRLSQLTGNEVYYRAAQRAMDTLDKHFKAAQPKPADPKLAAGPGFRGRLGALLPAHLDPAYPSMLQGEYTFGGLADSYYEYLIKQAQLTSFALEQYPRMYRDAIESAYAYLIRPVGVVPGRDDLTLIGSVNFGAWKPELQHLTCFAGGMLGLGAKLLDRPQDLETAINVTNACAWVYESSKTGIGGEQTLFYDKEDTARFVVLDSKDGSGKVRSLRGSPTGVRSADHRQIGRPETIEGVFYMWRLTGDRKWQDVGWTMFVNWVKHSITEAGFATVRDTNTLPVQKDDSEESFVMAESLKYYYLLFSPRDYMSLDDYVFSTEAHPFWITKPGGPRMPTPLWTGPEASDTASFTSQIGEGTWVQKWARVQQAAALAHQVWRPLGADEPVDEHDARLHGGELPVERTPDARDGRPPGNARRPLVRPPTEQLREARKKAEEAVSPVEVQRARGGQGEAGGGGRGMGGRVAPFAVAHKQHTYTLIPKLVYVHRIGMKRWRVSFGPGGVS